MILLLSLLKILIIAVLFKTLANLKQLSYYKVLRLKTINIYKKLILNFQFTQDSFFLLFVLAFTKWLIVNIAWVSINDKSGNIKVCS